MHLKELQQLLGQMNPGAASALDALNQLAVAVARGRDYLEEGNTVQSQTYLEHSFTLLLAACHYLNLDLERVVARERDRHSIEQAAVSSRAILVFSDHAELRVDGELRGTIPLYSAEDYQELRQIAQLFNCRVDEAHHLQLNLFARREPPAHAG